MAPWGGQQGAGGWRGQGQLAPPQAEAAVGTKAGSASQSSGLPFKQSRGGLAKLQILNTDLYQAQALGVQS